MSIDGPKSIKCWYHVKSRLFQADNRFDKIPNRLPIIDAAV